MSLAVELLFVWVPMICSVLFVAWFATKCYMEGLTPLQILIDRKFLMVFLYTGSLLAIYLSSLHFFFLGQF